MLFFAANDGSIIKSLQENVYQGAANANTIYLIAPFAVGMSVTVAFRLPNGVWTSPVAMTPQNALQGIVSAATGQTYAGWTYDIPNSVTALAGDATAQFFVYNAQGKITATSAVNFTVQTGVPAVLPDTPDEDVYESILSVLASLQTNLASGAYVARAVFPWQSTTTYGENEIVYVPVGEYGAEVQSVQAGNTNNPPYDEEGNLNTAWWREVVNYNTVTDDFFTEIKNYEEQAQLWAQQAQEAAENVGSYLGKTVQFVTSEADMTKEGTLYGLVTDAGKNLFALYEVRGGEPVYLGSANLVIDCTRYYLAALEADAWTSNAQTVSVDGLTADDDVTVMPIDEDAAVYITDGVAPTQITAGGIAFECNAVPEETVTVIIAVTKQQEVPAANGYYTESEIDGKIAEINAEISAEATARENADTELQNGINGLKEDSATAIETSVDTQTYILTFSLKNADGTVISTSSVDLPLESVVVSGSYDDDTKEVVLTLQNGSTVRFSVADLVDGLASVNGNYPQMTVGEAGKVANAITITVNGVPVVFDGSAARSVNINTQGAFAPVQVSIPATAWQNNAATLTAEDYSQLANVSANSTVLFFADDTSAAAYISDNIRLSVQGTGSVTFACDTAPTAAVSGLIIILN